MEVWLIIFKKNIKLKIFQQNLYCEKIDIAVSIFSPIIEFSSKTIK
jgi:hypothetical protein